MHCQRGGASSIDSLSATPGQPRGSAQSSRAPRRRGSTPASSERSGRRARIAARFAACRLEFRDRNLECLQAVVAAGNALQPIGGLGHAPGANSARGTLEGVSGRRSQCRLGAGDAPQHQSRLAHEDLEYFAFEGGVAERHLPQMVVIDSGGWCRLGKLATSRYR